MSIESAKLFIERMKTDEEFAKKVAKCKDADDCKAAVQEAGFDFTTSEIKEAGQEEGFDFTASGQELSDDDLDRVAGGKMDVSDVIVLAIVIGVLATQPKRR